MLKRLACLRGLLDAGDCSEEDDNAGLLPDATDNDDELSVDSELDIAPTLSCDEVSCEEVNDGDVYTGFFPPKNVCMVTGLLVAFV